MLSMRSLTRGSWPQYAAMAPRLHTSSLLYDSSESSSSDSDNKSTKKKSKANPIQSPEMKLQAQQDTENRLNSLLEKMMKASKVNKTSKLEASNTQEPEASKTLEPEVISKTLDLSVPPKKKVNKRPKKKYEESLLDAAKEVATSLGGDVQKTETEILKKLSPEKSSISEKVSNDAQTPLTLSELLAGMKIDRTPAEPSVPPVARMQRRSRAQEVAKKFESTSFEFRSKPLSFQQEVHRTAESARLYEGHPLEIFNKLENTDISSETPKLKTWKILQEREFALSLSHPPENIFQEMILWTEQGKLWKFPINNEQGLEEEQNVHFSEHVFMERHLQDWCPRRGPIRHFMELVCVGLSKNPYMTVKEKKEHIAWYREYFASKQDLLKELNAIEADIPLPSKQIAA